MTEAAGSKAAGDPAGKPGRRVQSVLFVCNFNAVRSAAAEAVWLVDAFDVGAPACCPVVSEPVASASAWR